MSRIDWLEELKWGEDQTDELRIAGYAYLRQGKYDIALKFFEALVILDPQSAYDAQTLGGLYLQLNQPAEAETVLRGALALDGDHSSTLLNLSKALLQQKKTGEALKLAHILKNEKDSGIANTANALILAFEKEA